MQTKNTTVIVAGKMPPPIGGQNIAVERIYGLLEKSTSILPVYWELNFSKSISQFRRFHFSKITSLFKALFIYLAIRLRARSPWILFPSGGPHFLPAIRDVVLLSLCQFSGGKAIVHFHAAGIANKFPTFPRWLQYALKTVYRRCWGAVVLSDYGKADPAALGMKRIFVIPNAIEDHNPERWIAGEQTQSQNTLVLLNVGHLCPDKGTPELLEAFSRVEREFPHLSLRLVGECLAPYSEAQLHADIARFGLTGKVNHVGVKVGDALMQEYRNASVFVFPSVASYESFGMVLIEAMMWGLPLVVSDWRANAEVVRQPRCGGVIYPPTPDHPTTLAEALRQSVLQRDTWPDWGRLNRANYETHYRLEILKANLETLFKQS